MVCVIARVAPISAAPRSARPRGSRAFNLLVLGDLSAMRGFHIRQGCVLLQGTKRRWKSGKANGDDMSAQTKMKPTNAPNALETFWMPFTSNRAFKARPRMISRAKDMYYYTPDGKQIMDACAGLWCTNAGHNRDSIVSAIQAQAAELDFSPSFQYGHPKSFELAARIAALAPGDLDHVFFCNSGSEATDTALKIALAYWNVQGQGQRTRLIG